MSAPTLPQRVLGAAFAAAPGLCARLARLETRVAAEALAGRRIDSPVFIAGLARSGSTVLLEALYSTGSFASARYADYPPVWWPWWWQQLRRRLPQASAPAQERAHRDRLKVTLESPEAFDEIFWMHFFPRRHDPALDQRLDTGTRNPAFEAFYSDHIRKCLAAQARPRYLCKGNYNLGRLPYLHRLFPDARFLIPVREPLAHVASLLKQHRLFTRLAAEHPSVARHLARTGHFEFGPQRRVERLGDAAPAQAAAEDFAAGRDALGYARQWAMSYGAMLDALPADPGLRAACCIVWYESICANPATRLDRIATHCRLDPAASASLVADWAPRLAAPDYYAPDFDARTADAIAHICAPVRSRLVELQADP